MAAKDIVYPQGHVPGMANYASLTAHIIGGNSNGPFDFDGGVDESKSLGVFMSMLNSQTSSSSRIVECGNQIKLTCTRLAKL